MEWKDINMQDDADRLMKVFGGFHDGCIREAHIWTGYWVERELSMRCPWNLHNKIRIWFQRQYTDPSAVELFFEEVTRFNLVPALENYDSIILAATLLVQGDTIFWSPEDEWRPEKPNRDESTWISAKKHPSLAARVDWPGDQLRYGPQAGWLATRDA